MDPKTLARYEILEPIGKGAMGVVYRARDPRIDRLLVLKTLRRDVLDQDDGESFIKRFYREAMAAGKLSHPSIVTIHDVDRDEEAGIDFIAMEYVPGVSLQDFLARGQRLPPARVIAVARQIADALDYAHGRGVVHRDIKPGNLILRDDGVVKITDFGIARLETSDLTRTGEYVGTPNYMSPEQVTGEPVDGKADQFSLAIVLYQLLTGVRPFAGENLTAITYRIVHEDPPPPVAVGAGVPPAVSAALMKGLAKSREARFASCTDLVDAVAAGLDPAAAPVSAAAVPDEIAPATVVLTRGKRKAASPPPPTPPPVVRDVRPADDREGDFSGATLSLSHELQRLESGAPRSRAGGATAAAPDEEAAFSMEDAEATHMASSGSRARPVAPEVVDERTEALAPRAAPPAPLAPDDEHTRIAEPTIPIADHGGDLATTTSEPSPLRTLPRGLAPAYSEMTVAAAPAGADVDATRMGPPSVPGGLPTFAGTAPAPGAPPRASRAGFLILLAVLLLMVFAGGAAVSAWWFLGRGDDQAALGPVPSTPELRLETPAPSPSPTLAPTPAPTVADETAATFERGMQAYTEGRLDDAERELGFVLAQDPAHGAARDYLALVQEERARQATPAPEPAPTESPEAATPSPAPTKGAARGTPSPRATTGTADDGAPQDEARGAPAPPGGGGSKLVVAFRHVLKEGELVVLVDGKERLRESFESERPGIARPFLKTKGEYEIDVPPGDHQVVVRVVAPKNKVDTEGTRKMSFKSGGSCTLKLGVGRFDRKIEMKDDCN